MTSSDRRNHKERAAIVRQFEMLQVTTEDTQSRCKSVESEKETAGTVGHYRIGRQDDKTCQD